MVTHREHQNLREKVTFESEIFTFGFSRLHQSIFYALLRIVKICSFESGAVGKNRFDPPKIPIFPFLATQTINKYAKSLYFWVKNVLTYLQRKYEPNPYTHKRVTPN